MTLKILDVNGPFEANGYPLGPDQILLVGDSNRLADGDDATYISGPGQGTLNYSIGLETLSGHEDGDPFTLVARMALTGGGSAPGQVTLFFVTDPTDTFVNTAVATTAAFGFDLSPTDGTIVDVEQTVAPWNPTDGLGASRADMVAAFEAGVYLMVRAFTNPDWDTPPRHFIYEAAVHVGTATVHRPPPRRSFPNSTDRGVGVARWPRARRSFPTEQ